MGVETIKTVVTKLIDNVSDKVTNQIIEISTLVC